MSNGHRILEFADLPKMHPPIGIALLHTYGPPAIIRLSIDPIPLPTGIMKREVRVDWLASPGNASAHQFLRDLGWSNLQDNLPNLKKLLIQLPVTVNAQELTGQAAIAVMALLVSDLENGVLQTVLPIGSGGDYLVQKQGSHNSKQIEASGIRQAETASVSLSRLNEKKAQVLKHSEDGYASVTTFCCPGNGAETFVHSYLQYCAKPVNDAGNMSPNAEIRGKSK